MGNGYEGARGFFGGDGGLFLVVRRAGGILVRTFAVYEDLCSVSICPHQYCLVVYLFLRQACLGVDDFEELRGVLV
jgi:hypothetical protein